jgi:GNAT superfamily N-acetyltransferase
VIEVIEASDEHDRRGALALRYAVYVEEMGRRQVHADHVRREVAEPEDASARLLVARRADGAIVGTACVHLKADIPRTLVDMYQLERFHPFHPAQASTTTKLIVDPRYRRTPLALRLAQACYDIGMEAGVAFNFIDCNAHLRPFFQRLGFRQVFPDFEHADYGTVTPMVLALRDFTYLREIASPFRLPDGPVDDDDASAAFLDDLLTAHQQPLHT